MLCTTQCSLLARRDRSESQGYAVWGRAARTHKNTVRLLTASRRTANCQIERACKVSVGVVEFDRALSPCRQLYLVSITVILHVPCASVLWPNVDCALAPSHTATRCGRFARSRTTQPTNPWKKFHYLWLTSVQHRRTSNIREFFHAWPANFQFGCCYRGSLDMRF